MSTVETPKGSSVKNPLRLLLQYGQSVWLDYVRRSLITQGELRRLIEEDGLRGVTSNPAIFEKAVTGSTDYTQFLEEELRGNADAKTVYERLAVRDIQDAADVLRPVYEESKKRDGYVSLEVSPLLARDTAGTIEEAKRLWKQIARPNVMIKVPGTPEGVPAFRELTREGINVNVTLLFALEAYETVAQAFILGLEARAREGGDVSGIASVASFFISRIDTAIDETLAARLKGAEGQEKAELQSLLGRVAIANGKVTYQRYKEIFRGPRWQALAEKGAQTQRVLWASTSTKNPHYRDVMYVEELIGPDTVDTIPPATFDAFRDHGRLRPSLEEDIDAAHDTMDTLARVGISMKDVTDKLLVDGLKIFSDAFDKLLKAVDQRRKPKNTTKINRLTHRLPKELLSKVTSEITAWAEQGRVRRLWARDASLWTGTDEANWLGWLGITEEQIENVTQLKTFAEEVKAEAFSHALLLGMGGSSLCPEVLAKTFGRVAGFPEFLVLDSTDPAQIAAIESRIDYRKTLFIVSSKSGSTLEPNIFKAYFFERAKKVLGPQAGSRFIAITDPGSKLQQMAASDSFRRIFPGVPSIGGRYSALSNFGMVPAAIMGLDLNDFLEQVEGMVQSTTASVPAAENPALTLGAILGVAAKSGRDKLTLIVSPRIHDLGAWLEQLLAESTGKDGKGIIPVDREPLGPPAVYGKDRLFVYVRLEAEPDAGQDRAVEALEAAGQPVVRVLVDSIADLGEEFFRWEFATAVAGSILGIHAFNQPDVEASKVATRRLTTEYEKTGSLAPEAPLHEEGGLRLFTDPKNAEALKKAVGKAPSLKAYMKAHLGRLGEGDYFAVLAYVPMTDAHEKTLTSIRQGVRDRKRVATCVGFGPRFLHSTGQAYKGGPGSGVFLQLTCDDPKDIPVPGQKYTFGVVKAAQARGDFEVLAERGRRALRIHIAGPVSHGLDEVAGLVSDAL
jgi:transaldolase/glucose-6-phosphate isomerase